MLFRPILLGVGALVDFHADTASAISHETSCAIYERELVSRSDNIYDYAYEPCETCLDGDGCNKAGGFSAAAGSLGW